MQAAERAGTMVLTEGGFGEGRREQKFARPKARGYDGEGGTVAGPSGADDRNETGLGHMLSPPLLRLSFRSQQLRGHFGLKSREGMLFCQTLALFDGWGQLCGSHLRLL